MFKEKGEGRVGFKDLRIHNESLLAKQGCRILTEQDSLLHQVLKALYFLNSSFFKSKLRYSTSYSWKEIWESKEHLGRGVLLENRKWQFDKCVE